MIKKRGVLIFTVPLFGLLTSKLLKIDLSGFRTKRYRIPPHSISREQINMLHRTLLTLALLVPLLVQGCTEPSTDLGNEPDSSAVTNTQGNESETTENTNDQPEKSESQDSEENQSPNNQPNSESPESEPTVSKPQISGEAFRLAAYEGSLDKVKSAVESGMDINGIDPGQKLTALHMAAYNGHTETVTYLISQGAVVDCRDSQGKTPLIHACTGPFAEAVKALIKAGADVNAIDTTEGFTPLMMAAGLGEPEVVEVLLENNADPSVKDQDQETAMDHARNAGHAAIAERLK